MGLAINSGKKNIKIHKKDVQNKTIGKRIFFHRLGFKRTAELLIKNGAEVNTVGRLGKTALIHATERGKRFEMMFIWLCF